MKRVLCIGLIGITALSFVGCVESKKEAKIESNKSAIEENNDKEKPEEITKTIEDKSEGETTEKPNNNVDNTDRKIKSDKPAIGKSNDKEKPKQATKTPEDKSKGKTTEKPNDNVDNTDKTERVFKISTKNVDYKVVNGGEIKTVGLGVAENIKKILSTVSSKYFDGKKIELKTINTVGNKKIAVINLTGDEKYWNQKMQGSAGGQITEYTLIENVLQREYKGYWIDGVRFTLNGKEIEDDGHIPELSKTAYR